MKYVTMALLFLVMTIAQSTFAFEYGGCMAQATDAAKAQAADVNQEYGGKTASCHAVGNPKVVGPVTVEVQVKCDKFEGTYNVDTGTLSEGCSKTKVEASQKENYLSGCRICG